MSIYVGSLVEVVRTTSTDPRSLGGTVLQVVSTGRSGLVTCCTLDGRDEYELWLDQLRVVDYM